MLKYVYKILFLFFLFIGGVIFFGRTIPEISIISTTATSLQGSVFPTIALQTGKYTINTLHGYSSQISSADFRESITPLDLSKKLTVKISENKSRIKRLDYELFDISNNKILEEDNLTAFDTKEGCRTADIRIGAGLDTSTEYGFSIKLTTNYSKKIYFYTRIKYYSSDFYLKEKLDFVKSFHAATFGEKKNFNISPYLELNTNDDSTFANVDIHSGISLIKWKKLKPKKLTKVIPVINEINIETAAISQNYIVEAETDSGRETYYVKEFYRIRYSGNRIYLLAFNRTMEAFFDPDLFSLKKNEFKIGISNAEDLDITSSDSNNKLAFVRNGSLWYYDLKKNLLTSVFSFDVNSKDYTGDYYDQHDIKILRMDDDGNISFILYGYMNGGDYEGRVGILLYDYSAKDNQITERVYIPLETTYQKLKEDFGNFSYVNNKNIFYFCLDDIVYAYNMASKKYEILTKNASKDNFSMLKAARCFIWSNLNKKGRADSINILDLDTSKMLKVSAPSGQSMVVLGTIDANIVYGYVRNKDIFESTTGEVVMPAYRLDISNCKGRVLRKYRVKNRYVTNAAVEDNVIHLKRIKRQNGKFVNASGDTIMNQKDTGTQLIDISTRITQKTLTEKYLSLPAGFVVENIPHVTSTKCVMITENTTLHFTEKSISDDIKYYIYARGCITQAASDAAQAILLADEQMGVVMDSRSHIVWERGGKFLSKKLSGVSYPSGSDSSIQQATQMLLQAAQVTAEAKDLKGKSILSMLKPYLDQPVNLTGCTVDEILYFVSGEKPVIGMIDNDHAVLITEYTSSTVTWMDPVTHHAKTVSLAAAERIFKNAGYRFVSYVAY